MESADRLRQKLSEAQSAFAVALVLLVALATGAAIGYAALVRHYQGRLAAQTAAAESAASEAETRWTAAQSELESMRVAAGRAEADLRTTQESLNALRDRLGEVEQRFGQYRAESESRTASLRNENSALVQQVTDLTEARARTEQRARSAGQETVELRGDLQTEIALKQSIKARLEDRVGSLDRQVDRLRGNLLQVHQRHDREQQVLRERLTAEEQKREQLHAGLEGVNAALSELNSQATNLSETLAALLNLAGQIVPEAQTREGLTVSTESDGGTAHAPGGS